MSAELSSVLMVRMVRYKSDSSQVHPRCTFCTHPITTNAKIPVANRFGLLCSHERFFLVPVVHL